MAGLKSLAKDTAIYGMSSIIGRFLNYLLVPLYTAKLTVESGGYGVITNIYSYVALLLVILTYGMETAFFRFANKQDEDPQHVYSSILISVGSTSLLFILFILVFLPQVSSLMGYADHPEYIGVMAVCVAIDAFQTIPFAYLRYKKRPIKFATLKLLFIIINIALNLVYFILLPSLYESHPYVIGKIYDPSVGVGYAFFINLFCTALITLFFKRELTGFKYVFDAKLIQRILNYSWPILILGITGILNQTADKILFPFIYTGSDATAQLGIYGAASKVAMIMAVITQAFRYAYEPFVFGKTNDLDNNATQATAMKFFIIFTLLAFLTVIAYIDLIKYIIAPDYWSGLKVIPVVMAAEIMMGVYFNLSFWYKLTDRTIWGAIFSGIGCAVLIVVNVIFVPRYGYMACAWGGFAGYCTAMLLSYFLGQKYYPVNYPIKQIMGYMLLAIAIYCTYTFFTLSDFYLNILLRTALLIVFIIAIAKTEHIKLPRHRPEKKQ